MAFFALAGIWLVPDATLFVHIAIIRTMVYVLNRTLFKPVNEILARREARIKGVGTGSAADLLQQVEDKTRHYETTLRETRTSGYRKVEEVRTGATRERQAQIVAVREELANLTAAQKETIAAQVAQSRDTLQNDAQRIAQEIGGRILGRAVKG